MSDELRLHGLNGCKSSCFRQTVWDLRKARLQDKMEFEPVIGLEIHVELDTATKIFCGCATTFGAPPNLHTCPVCLGMPGTLPVLNKKVVEFAMRLAIATHCRIKSLSRFARKNYFYPDLPKGYQISQHQLPIAQDGYVDIDIKDRERRIGITEIHMEEDAAKLSHDPDRLLSRVDYNRTGIPLIEIVSDPDLRSPVEAGIYLRKLHSIVRYLNISDGNMEEGSFRCDANISLRPRGTTALGTRTELKNLNSFRYVEKAIQYEIDRQREALIDNGEVLQETRQWDPIGNRTISMRGKEEAHDYRYFPDPDLLPLIIDDSWIDAVRESLPELPDEKRDRFLHDYGLSENEIGSLISDRELADFFETCVKTFPNPKQVSNWIMGSLLELLNARGIAVGASPVSPEQLSGLLILLDKGTISGRMAKAVFEEMASSGKNPEDIVEEKGLVQVTDESAIETVVVNILARNPAEVADYQKGKTKLLGFFVGQVMKETRGKANPKIVNEVLKKELMV